MWSLTQNYLFTWYITMETQIPFFIHCYLLDILELCISNNKLDRMLVQLSLPRIIRLLLNFEHFIQIYRRENKSTDFVVVVFFFFYKIRKKKAQTTEWKYNKLKWYSHYFSQFKFLLYIYSKCAINHWIKKKKKQTTKIYEEDMRKNHNHNISLLISV